METYKPWSNLIQLESNIISSQYGHLGSYGFKYTRSTLPSTWYTHQFSHNMVTLYFFYWLKSFYWKHFENAKSLTLFYSFIFLSTIYIYHKIGFIDLPLSLSIFLSFHSYRFFFQLPFLSFQLLYQRLSLDLCHPAFITLHNLSFHNTSK